MDVWLVAEAEEHVAMVVLRKVQCLLKTLLGDKSRWRIGYSRAGYHFCWYDGERRVPVLALGLVEVGNQLSMQPLVCMIRGFGVDVTRNLCPIGGVPPR